VTIASTNRSGSSRPIAAALPSGWPTAGPSGGPDRSRGECHSSGRS
jgi:hypothetical protein